MLSSKFVAHQSHVSIYQLVLSTYQWILSVYQSILWTYHLILSTYQSILSVDLSVKIITRFLSRYYGYVFMINIYVLSSNTIGISIIVCSGASLSEKLSRPCHSFHGNCSFFAQVAHFYHVSNHCLLMPKTLAPVNWERCGSKVVKTFCEGALVCLS